MRNNNLGPFTPYIFMETLLCRALSEVQQVIKKKNQEHKACPQGAEEIVRKSGKNAG